MAADLPGVPGLVQETDADGNFYWTVCGKSGLLIPVRNELGQIVAVQVRPDQAANGGKYRYLSSNGRGGPGPGAPVHVPVFEGDKATVRVTEGVLKADVATEKSGILTIGLPGVSAWPKAAPTLKALNATTAVLALDADAETNSLVASSLAHLARDLKQQGFAVELERWAVEDGKGIDDLLAAGKQPERLRGEPARRAIKEILAAAREADGKESTDAKDEPVRDPADPHLLAELYLDQPIRSFGPDPDAAAPATDASQPGLRCWRDEWYAWDGAAYRAVSEKDIRYPLCHFIKGHFDRLNVEEVKAYHAAAANGATTAKGPPTSRRVTTTLVGNTLQALGGMCVLPSSLEPPTWIGPERPFPADEVLVAYNGLVHLPSLLAGRPSFLPPTPDLFTVNALNYAFDAEACEPRQWLAFLNQLWPDDPESIMTLQDWFGLCLLPDTRHQKMLLLVGPTRSGKGTIAKVLTELVGEANVAGPTLSSLGTDFGLAPLLGKSLAIIPDARLSGRDDMAMLTERLLAITGQDTLTVNRKHVAPITTQLPTRLMLMSNELPRLSDASQAIVNRMVLLYMTRSWAGQEDHDLFGRLQPELPGILLWAIAGWQRLRARGRFVQPATGGEVLEELGSLVSPVGVFLKECCDVGPDKEVVVADLFRRWREWCQEKGQTHVGTEQLFGRNLRAALPRLRLGKPRGPDGKQRRVYYGLALRPAGQAQGRRDD
jgi:putative DNA primase/helicase